MFNTNKNGKLIAKIIDKDKKPDIKIYVSEKKDNNDDNEDVNKLNKNSEFNAIKLKKGELQLMTDKNKQERFTMFIAGSAGSGKSYFIREFLKENFIPQYKKQPIYLFSVCNDDKAFEDIKEIERFNIKDDKFLDDEIKWEEFKDCCCIFDDIDSLGKSALGKYLYKLRNDLLVNARKYGVSVITTAHSCSGIDLKSVLQESQYIVFFMANYNRSLKYLCENYIGLTKLGIKNLLTLNNSRWTCYIKTYPNIIMDKYNIYKVIDLNNKDIKDIQTN